MSVLQTETIVKFGTGDIEVATIRPENGCLDYGIAFRQKEVSEIGSPNPTSIGKSTDALGCFLRFEFTSAESVAVVIAQLERVRMALSGED